MLPVARTIRYLRLTVMFQKSDRFVYVSRRLNFLMHVPLPLISPSAVKYIVFYFLKLLEVAF